MDFFDQISRKLSIGTNIVSKKADELIATTELKITISQLESEIEDAIMMLGETVFQYYINNNNSMSLNEVQGRCREINRMYQELNRLKKKYYVYKGTRTCSYCGEEVEYGGRFCSSCGNKIAY